MAYSLPTLLDMAMSSRQSIQCESIIHTWPIHALDPTHALPSSRCVPYHTVLGMHLAAPSRTMTIDRANENSAFGLYIRILVLLLSMIKQTHHTSLIAQVFSKASLLLLQHDRNIYQRLELDRSFDCSSAHSTCTGWKIRHSVFRGTSHRRFQARSVCRSIWSIRISEINGLFFLSGRVAQ
jgi:hypothetical protein